MQSAQTRVAVSAHSVANLLAEDFRPRQAIQTSLAAGASQARVEQGADRAPVSLAREVGGQIQASTQVSASARVFAVGAELRGTLLDLFG